MWDITEDKPKLSGQTEIEEKIWYKSPRKLIVDRSLKYEELPILQVIWIKGALIRHYRNNPEEKYTRFITVDNNEVFDPVYEYDEGLVNSIQRLKKEAERLSDLISSLMALMVTAT